MENDVKQPQHRQTTLPRDNQRLFWIVFFGALAAHIVIELVEGVIDYLA